MGGARRQGGGAVGKQGEDKQPDRKKRWRSSYSLQTVETGSKWEEERGSLCEVGQQGGGASVGEAQGCVLKWTTLLRGVPLVSQAENRKVGVKSESAPPATRHSQQLSSTAPGFFSVSLFCSLTHLLSFTLTHTQTHTHQPSLLAERRRDHRRTVKHLYCCSPSSSAIAMPRMWTLILGVMLGLLASSRSEIQGEEIVPFPQWISLCLGIFFFIILPKLYRSLRQQELLKRF